VIVLLPKILMVIVFVLVEACIAILYTEGILEIPAMLVAITQLLAGCAIYYFFSKFFDRNRGAG
jgi:hypothetical protein